mmetsp:Transcript_42915/g.77108  ORF Transcript_42915/g.77108 Transcript_42915/m.77108 type:complete len:185 (-) Transcript_42915:244-798(-)
MPYTEQELAVLEQEIAQLRSEVQALETGNGSVEAARQGLEEAVQQVQWYDMALEFVSKMFGVSLDVCQQSLGPSTVKFELSVFAPGNNPDHQFQVLLKLNPKANHALQAVEVMDTDGVEQPQFQDAVGRALAAASSPNEQLWAVLGTIIRQQQQERRESRRSTMGGRRSEFGGRPSEAGGRKRA